MKTMWTFKRFDNGICTYSHSGKGPVYVGTDAHWFKSPFVASHSAAAACLARLIGNSFQRFAEGLRT